MGTRCQTQNWIPAIPFMLGYGDDHPRATPHSLFYNLFSVQTYMGCMLVKTASIIQAQADKVVSHVAPKWCFPTDSSEIRPVHKS